MYACCLKLPRNFHPALVRSFTTFRPLQSKNHYETLNLEKTCSEKDIRDAYIRLSKEFHPDKNLSKSRKGDIRFVEINEAYSVLSKADSRKNYDYCTSHCESATIPKRPQRQSPPQMDESLASRYYYVVRNYERKKNARNKNFKRIPIAPLLICVIMGMTIVGMLEFRVIKNTVTKPTEIIHGIPVFSINVIPPNTTIMSPEEAQRYHAAKRKIIEETVRSMKAEKDAKLRDEQRLRERLDNKARRETDLEIIDV